MNQNVIISNNNSSKNKKTLLYIIIILLLVIIISVVGIMLLNNENLTSNKNSSRTVMIYMVGSNLESKSGLATSDLNSINLEGLEENNVNVLLIAGGSKKWYNDYIDKNETSIYKLESGGIKKVKTQPLLNMGKSEVLSEFLKYVYDNYKTDKYDLLFWDHGGAITGSEFDELHSDDNLSLVEFRDALKDSPFNSNNKLEVVIFRTCLNATIEVASVFADYSNYLVASEEVTLGANYTSVLNFINEIKPSDKGIDIGKKYITAYQNQIKSIRDKSIFSNQKSIYSTYSLMNLNNVNGLIASVNDFFGNVNVQSDFNSISRIRANLRQYGQDEPSYDMVDLYSLVTEMRTLDQNRADKVLSEFNKTVVYNWATNPESRGISIYFPYNGTIRAKTSLISVYNGLSGFDRYKKFITDFNTAKLAGGGKTYSYSMNKINVETENKTKNVDFTLELTDEQKENFAQAKYVVYRKNEDGYYSPIYIRGKADFDGNNITASIRNKQLRVYSTTDKEDKGATLVLREVEEDDKYVRYETTVLLQRFKDIGAGDYAFDPGIINLLYDKESKKIDVISAVYKEDGKASTAIIDFSYYDSVAFSLSSGWDILDENGNYIGTTYDENGQIRGNGIITGWEEKPGQYAFTLDNFEDKLEYYCVFEIYDIYGNVSYSKLVKMK